MIQRTDRINKVELRFGSYVYYKDEIRRVITIETNGVRLAEFRLNPVEGETQSTVITTDVIPFDSIKAIPITEDKLEWLGFEFENSLSFSEYFNKSFGKIKTYVIKNNKIWFCTHFDWLCRESEITSKRGWCVGRRNTNCRYEGWNYQNSAEVYFIHQLQNALFAIREEDFNIIIE